MSYQKYDSYRIDSEFVNTRGNTIQYSVFVPVKSGARVEKYQSLKMNCPCVIYCHSQQGCRIEGLFLQEFCIENGIGLCLFDFGGCGKSTGEFVTLGWKETDDLAQMIDLVTGNLRATQICLWGRSMGAVTSIMFAERSSFFISSMVGSADSGLTLFGH
jgi:alpha/beta superfamily hydrolase